MKKIMFSDRYGLTEAVLSGRKTQTRRIIKPQPEVSERMGMVWKGYAYGIASPAGSPSFLKDVYHNFLSGTNFPQCHRYKIGEVVAVAQRYKDCNDGIIEAPNLKGFTDKRCVVAALMPHQIRITNVRVERLQDISDEDCIAEGIEMWRDLNDKEHYCFFDKRCKGLFPYSYSTPREAYAALIDRIFGKGVWEENPYVFVYDFEIVD